MAMMRGSTYEMPVYIKDCNGVVVTGEMVERASFTFGDITKVYGDGGEVRFDAEKGAWIVPLTEEETFAFRNVVAWQARFKFIGGRVDGTVVKSEYLYDSIDLTRLSAGGGEDA